MNGCFPPSISWNQNYVKNCNLTPSNGCANVNSHNFFELDNFPCNVIYYHSKNALRNHENDIWGSSKV
jgi:hypothetical protein